MSELPPLADSKSSINPFYKPLKIHDLDMPSSSPSPKKARTSGSSTTKDLLHNIYQVIYNLSLGKSDISRYVLHCFLNDNEDWLKFRLYALVVLDESEDGEKEVLARWKGYVRMSSVRGSVVGETSVLLTQNRADREIVLGECPSK